MKKYLIVLVCALFLLTGCMETTSTPEPTKPEPTQAVPENGKLFSTMTLDGKAVSLSDYSDNKLIMVNLWEPWCGPCVNEMPDLNKLYQEYKDKGFVILGVFADMDYKSDAKTIVKQKGIEYPILLNTKEFEKFATEYVPTTVFLDGKGNLLSDEPFIGSNSYSEWKSIIDSYLNK